METTNSLKTFATNPRFCWQQLGPHSYKASGMLHIETAETFREMLLEMQASRLRLDLSEAEPAFLDLSEIDTCGTPGVQLLLSAAQTMASKGLSIQFSPASPAVEEAFVRFGAAFPSAAIKQTGVSAL